MRLPGARARGRALRGKPKIAVAAIIASLLVTTAQPVTAAPEAPRRPAAPVDRTDPSTTDAGKRAEQLGAGWQQSGDRAWTTSGDADGFHLLVADASTGYTWRTAATLSEAGFDADQWIGNACVTESGKRAVVVYAPRIFTNRDALSARGGFSAVVDLDTGAVTKLNVRSSLAYFNPGCGNGEQAVLTQEGDEFDKTGLSRVDAAAGSASARIEVDGQVTSAVPTKAGIVAAARDAVVKIDEKGVRTRIAAATGTPFLLKPDADGGLVFLEQLKDDVRVRRSLPADPKAKLTTLATGALKDLAVTSGRAGKVFITGTAKSVSALPPSVAKIDVARDATVSTEGRSAVERSEWDGPAEGDAARPAKVELKVLPTGQRLGFKVDPAARVSDKAASGRALHPKLGDSKVQAQLAGVTDAVDADRVCSIPRGDPDQMATQPTPAQVEWAADRAVLGTLEQTTGAQKMFPRVAIDGGDKVPPQILLGIMAQESNLWQAARYALPGVTANPLIGNYFGLLIYNRDGSDDWDIHWDKADCGYGITQVTDGMRLAGREGDIDRHGRALPLDQQRAIALDHKSNIAKGLQMISEKWNQTRRAGLIVNDGSYRKIENWFFAAWAYNSGFNVNKGDGSPWGLGWTNNPINPRYQTNRNAFLDTCQCDAKNPQYWPYPEKIMGWAAHSIGTTSGPGFAPAWWVNPEYRSAVKPPSDLFCKAENNCYPGQKWVPDDPSVLPEEGDDPEPAGPCDNKNPATGKRDLKCWWHFPATWKNDCTAECGNWNFTYDVEPSPGWGTNYPPRCGRETLPQGALIVDDSVNTPQQPSPAWADPARKCVRDWNNQGKFELDFHDSPSARIDFHQIGAGFDNHFWFGHTRQNDEQGGFARVTGTWTLNQSLSWARVLVHLPDHGAHTQQAKYEIDLGNGITRERYISQGTEANKWVSLGVYQFAGPGKPTVRLSSATREGLGTADVAWDAIAFQPLPGKPKHVIAALGDSFSSGEGAGGYYKESDNNHGNQEWNACRRSQDAWPRKFTLPGVDGYVGNASDRFQSDVELGFVACSGAVTWNLDGGASGTSYPRSWDEPDNYDLGEGQFREIRQLDSGVLSADTTLVTLSIGGNDANFSKAIADCVVFDCSTESYQSLHKSNIDKAQANILRVLNNIKVKARNAKIVLMGYPALFSTTNACAYGITGDEARAIAGLAQYMSDKLKQTVTSAGSAVSFADPRSQFAGHGICDPEPMINSYIFGPQGEGDFHAGDKQTLCWLINSSCASRSSVHPNVSGTYGYGRVLEAKLQEMNYGR
ncbi:SGNH/GDSL hydrolase family protein [Lentzea sp. NPDC058436]|uniref:golvesin C-terminal-like domain-containing protein n=1 Tax=Lentzea sp. NPDC058436 TaxID=3346499 RepID=UPI0036489BD1